jgi:lipid-binding SYLF domain-containing protein
LVKSPDWEVVILPKNRRSKSWNDRMHKARIPADTTAMRLHVLIIVVSVVLISGSSASPLDGEAELMDTAAAAFEHSLTDRNAIPVAIMRQARAIAIFPAAPTAEAVREVRGVLTVGDSKPGRWKPPVIVTGTTRLHVPVGRTPGDIIIIAISRRGSDYLAKAGSSRVVMSPGPVGRTTKVDLKADIVGYARYRLAFAGIMVQQVVIEEMKNDPPLAMEWQECINSLSPEPEGRKTESPESRTAITAEGLPASCFRHLR